MSKGLVLPPFTCDVEAIEVVRALAFANEIRLSSINLEGDSKVVIKALRSDDESFTSFGHLIADAKSFTDAFSGVSFSHTRR